MDGLEILPVRGIGDVAAGDDLAELIGRAAPWLRDTDILVVTSKIVSKAEGRLVEVPPDGPERDAARARVLAGETARVVAQRGSTSIVATHHGYVLASAGIDASNVDKTHLVLLPVDPDASARALRAAFAVRGLRVGVIVSDTMGRAWRNGLTDVALGAAGIAPLRDHRGEIDPYGNELALTEMAVVDELAAAGELVKGKCDQVPVAVIRGYPAESLTAGPGARALIRDAASDMFSLGTSEARTLGLRDAALLGDANAALLGDANAALLRDAARSAPAELADRADAVGRAIALIRPVLADSTTITVRGDDIHLAPPTGAAGVALIRLGTDTQRVRAALAAEGLGSTVTVADEQVRVTVTGPAQLGPAQM